MAAQPSGVAGFVSGTRSLGAECETDCWELDNQRNRSAKRRPFSRSGSRAEIRRRASKSAFSTPTLKNEKALLSSPP